LIPLDNGRIYAGFNSTPGITGATSTGAFSHAEVGSSYPNGIGLVDVCLKDAQTGTGTFTLSFAGPISSAALPKAIEL
jgi:hypothetical protein